MRRNVPSFLASFFTDQPCFDSGSLHDALERHREAAFATALRGPDIAGRMANLGMELAENGTESYVRYVRQDLERYAAAVKLLGGKVQ